MNRAGRFRIIDLFCGAGGLSLGFQRAGFEIVLAIDKDHDALETNRLNLGNHTHKFDLSGQAIPTLPDADIIVGGPPCQGFSSAGLRKIDDGRNSLAARFAEIVACHMPPAFVFENVEGFLTAEQGKYIFDLLVPLIEVGYRIHLQKINAANFGIPQHRKRVIAIGGLGWTPTFPEPTHSAFGAPGARLAGLGMTSTPTVREALSDLPPASNQPPGQPQGHHFRPLQGIDLQRAEMLKLGETMRDLPEALRHSSYQRRANRRVMDGTPTERRGGAPSGIRRLRPDEPSKAITGGALAELLHPYENRPLTIRECARLQSFPDSFVFYGNPSSQIQLIGNAVPPALAEIIARQLADDLAVAEISAGKGCLLSFVPTLSDGMSPALKKVVDQVARRIGLIDTPVQNGFLWD